MPRHACRIWISSLCAASIAVSGCTVGPHLIQGSRTRYNNAVQITASQEMLLNLLRSKYGEPPGFLAVSGITSQFEVDSSVSFGTEFGLGRSRWGGKFTAADRPTISLTPLQDEQFTRRFLSPINLDTIYLFARNGRRVEQVLRLVVDQINGVRNSTHDTGIDTSPFAWLAQSLGDLAEQQQLEFAYEKKSRQASPPLGVASVTGADIIAAVDKGYLFQAAGSDQSVVLTDNKNELVLRIAPQAIGSPDMEAVTELLRLKPGQAAYPLELATEGQLKQFAEFHDELHVSTRSVEEILHFLSAGVTVPRQHREQGLVQDQTESTETCPAPGNDLLRIHSSKRCPRCAAVAVQYRGYWFYIDDADAESKETFELLLELYNLEIRGGGAASIPLLTLPLGR